MRLAIAALSLLAIPAFAGEPTGGAVPGASVTICAIRQNPTQYVGQVVTVSATYSTDSSHYEYLEDPSCNAGNTLDIGFKVPERDASVEEFKAAQAAECRKTGSRGLCVIEAQVVLRGRIASTTGAHLQPNLTYLVINPHSVLGYSFRAER